MDDLKERRRALKDAYRATPSTSSITLAARSTSGDTPITCQMVANAMGLDTPSISVESEIEVAFA